MGYEERFFPFVRNSDARFIHVDEVLVVQAAYYLAEMTASAELTIG